MAPRAERTAFNVHPSISRWHHVPSEPNSRCSSDITTAPHAERAASNMTCRANCIQYAASDLTMAPRGERTAFNVQPLISRRHPMPSELHATCCSDIGDGTTCRARCIQLCSLRYYDGTRCQAHCIQHAAIDITMAPRDKRAAFNMCSRRYYNGTTCQAYCI